MAASKQRRSSGMKKHSGRHTHSRVNYLFNKYAITPVPGATTDLRAACLHKSQCEHIRSFFPGMSAEGMYFLMPNGCSHLLFLLFHYCFVSLPNPDYPHVALTQGTLCFPCLSAPQIAQFLITKVFNHSPLLTSRVLQGWLGKLVSNSPPTMTKIQFIRNPPLFQHKAVKLTVWAVMTLQTIEKKQEQMLI